MPKQKNKLQKDLEQIQNAENETYLEDIEAIQADASKYDADIEAIVADSAADETEKESE
jgi:hypothetical protein